MNNIEEILILQSLNTDRDFNKMPLSIVSYLIKNVIDRNRDSSAPWIVGDYGWTIGKKECDILTNEKPLLTFGLNWDNKDLIKNINIAYNDRDMFYWNLDNPFRFHQQIAVGHPWKYMFEIVSANVMAHMYADKDWSYGDIPANFSNTKPYLLEFQTAYVKSLKKNGFSEDEIRNRLSKYNNKRDIAVTDIIVSDLETIDNDKHTGWICFEKSLLYPDKIYSDRLPMHLRTLKEFGVQSERSMFEYILYHNTSDREEKVAIMLIDRPHVSKLENITNF